MKKINFKKKIDLFIFFILIILFFLNQNYFQFANAKNFSLENIKNIIISDQNEIHIFFSKSVEDFELKYDNFEKFIEIDQELNLKCGWINSKNANCLILNSEKILGEKKYEIKIYDSEKKNENPIFQKKIILNKVIFLDARIQKWENRNLPIIKINLDNFVESDLFLKNLNLIQRNNQKIFSLKEIEESENFLSPDEKKENAKLLRKKFNFKGLTKNEIKNIETKYKKIFFIKPISLLDEDLDFDLFFIRNFENQNNDEQNEFERKNILPFKTFISKGEFLGITCNNYKHELINLKLNDSGQKSNRESKCLGSSYLISLLFSTPFKNNIEDLIEQIDFSWPVDKKEILDENRRNFNLNNNSNPFQIIVPIADQDGKEMKISFNPNAQNKIKEIFSQKSKSNKKKIYDDFGNEFNQKFVFNFETINHAPHFNEENFQNIFNFDEKANDNKIFFNLKNIKEYEIEYELIFSDSKIEKDIIKKNLDNIEKNHNHIFEINLNDIFKNRSAILFGKINAIPIEDDLHKTIQTKIFAQKTSLEILVKKFQKKITINIFDIEKNKYIENTEIFLKELKIKDFFENKFQNSKIIFSGKTNQDGEIEIENFESLSGEKNSEEKIYIIEAKKDSKISWIFLTKDFEKFDENFSYDQNSNFYLNEKFQDISFFSFPDSFVQKINNDFFFKIYLKKLKDDFDLSEFKKKFTFDLYLQKKNSNLKILIKKNIDFDEKNFLFSDSFLIPKDFSLGEYNFQIKISDLKNKSDSDFVNLFEIQIQDFEEINFKINFEINKNKIFFDEEFKISSKTEFYSGTQKNNSKIQITSNQKEKSFSEFFGNKDFIFENLSNFWKKDESQKNLLFFESIMNDEGKFSKDFKLNENPFSYGEIEIQATVFDENQKSISKKQKIDFFGSKIFVGIKPENLEDFYFSKNIDQNFSFLAVNSEKKPIEKIEIYSVIEKENKKSEWVRIHKKILKTDSSGKAQMNFNFKDSGKYRIACFAKDNSEKQISSFEFFIDNKKKINNIEKIHNQTDQKNEKIFEVKEIEILGFDSKKIFHSDKKIEFQIQNPFPENEIGTKGIFIFENSSKQFISKKNLNEKIQKIELPIPEEFFGKTKLQIIAFNKDQNGKIIFKTKTKEILIHDDFEEKFNSLNIFTEKNNYQPNDEIKILFSNSKNENDQIEKIEKLECSLIAMDEFIFDIQPGDEKIENFKIQNQVFSRNLIFQNSFYHIFGEKNHNIPRALFSDSSNMFKNIEKNYESKFFFEQNSKQKNSIIHFEKSFNIDLFNEFNNEKILSYKAPSDFSGNIKNIFICNIPNSNRFFTKFFDVKSFKDFEIKIPENLKNLSPGETINFNIEIINHLKNISQNQNLKIKAEIKENSLSKKISIFEFQDEKEKNKLNTKIEKQFSLENEKNFNFSLGLKESDSFVTKNNENLEIEFFIFKHNEKNEEILLDSKKIILEILIPEQKKTIIEQDMIDENSELIKKINLNSNLNGQKSKISISLSKTIFNNLENIFMIGNEYDENFFRTSLAKFFVINAYNFFIQKEKFANFKIFENFIWHDSEKKSNNLFYELFDYQNEKYFFREFKNQDNFKKNIFFASQKLFVLNFIDKIKQVNDQSLKFSKEKKSLAKFLLNFIQDDSEKNQIELLSYALYNLSFINEISNFTEVQESFEKILKNDYKNLSLQGKIFLLHAFLNLNQINEKTFEFLSNQIEQIIENYSNKNGLFINLKNPKDDFGKSIFNFSQNDSCLNCSMLSFLVDFNSKFKNFYKENNNNQNFNSDLPFLFAKTIINRDFKINFRNSDEMIFCLESFMNYLINFENYSLNQNEKNDEYVDFQIFINSKLNSDEKISIPNYIEIENIKQFLEKDIIFKIKNLNKENDHDSGEEKKNHIDNLKKNNFIYSFIKFDLYEKINAIDLKKKNPSSQKSVNNQIFGIKLEKEFSKYNFEEKNFIKINNLQEHQIKKGDLIQINLKVSSNEKKKFLLLEDIIPNFGSFLDEKMILNEKIFLYDKEKNKNENFLNPILSDNKKILFYIENLSENETNFSYIIRVNYSGNFNLLGAKIREINNEQIFASTDSYKNFSI